MLRQVKFFSELSIGELDQLVAAFRKKDIPKGKTVVREGEPSDAFYIIASGYASVLKKTGWFSSRLIAQIGPGDYFGEMGIMTGAPRAATVRAYDDLQLFELKRVDFRDLLLANPAINKHLEAQVKRYQ